MMNDLIAMQVIRYASEQIADEMGHTLVRTGRSTIITEIKDISCVITDAKGQTVAQAHHTPSLLAGFEITMKELVATYRPEDLSPGDVIVMNDPYKGGQHVMDLYAIAPAFHQGELIGFVGNITHHSDMGGMAAGGVAGGVREIYLEGLRLPMVKIMKAGTEDREIVGIIENQIRLPRTTLGDIRAQISSLMVGTGRLDRLFSRYGKVSVQAAWNALLDYSERRMRKGLLDIPDGVYEAEDFIDDDGVNDRPIRVAVRVTISGDRAIVDLTGSDDQAEGNTNSTIANTHAAIYYVMIAVVDPHAPPNSGCYRPIEVVTRKGSIADPLPPAAVASRTNASAKIAEAMFFALSAAVPDRVCGGSHGQITTCGFSGLDPQSGQRFIYTDIQGGGNGGRPAADGADGQDSHLPRFMNTPVEAVESRFPIRIDCYEFVPDTGGAGRFRGSLALRRDIRLLTGPVSFARYSDRHKIAPKGVFGGKEGSCGRITRNPGSKDAEVLKSKGLDMVAAGDVVRLQLPGAGGYGDPLTRDLGAIDRDLRDGKVTPGAAERDYSVVVDASGIRVDRKATERLRNGGHG
ncbi:hydantoinase B/oxoprolinase family protein [Paracoccus sp. (in: a-proteobacteria)]|uniref:hydantoinase B/oxoprolinase family protein n=1 Tax=Paracoccus sp. TaxID=267 RepID=UPI003A896050